jgi:calcineurin-like phosphoesterase family protein
MTIFFTSDLHFSHARITEFTNRPWTAEENNEALIALWNSQVTQKDTVYHLGDFIFAGPMRAHEAYDILSQLNGKKFLLFGNHCHLNMWKQLQERDDWNKLNTTHLGHYHELKMDRKRICMFHYPILNWRDKHHGTYHIHGHCHGSFPDPDDERRMDVGLDAHPENRFYTWDEIRARMSAISIPTKDHHDSDI